MGSGRQTLLVIEDDALVMQAIVREARAAFATRTVSSAAEALALFARDQLLADVAAAVIDVGLPDGDGLQVAAALRARRGNLPILVLTASNDPGTINRAHMLRAEFVCKPFFRDNLRSFLQRLPIGPGPWPDASLRLATAVERTAREHGLTSREAQILGLAVDGVPRANIPQVLGVSENTVKSQVRSLLDKTGNDALSQLVWQVRSSEMAQ